MNEENIKHGNLHRNKPHATILISIRNLLTGVEEFEQQQQQITLKSNKRF